MPGTFPGIKVIGSFRTSRKTVIGESRIVNKNTSQYDLSRHYLLGALTDPMSRTIGGCPRGVISDLSEREGNIVGLPIVAYMSSMSRTKPPQPRLIFLRRTRFSNLMAIRSKGATISCVELPGKSRATSLNLESRSLTRLTIKVSLGIWPNKFCGLGARRRDVGSPMRSDV